MNIKKNFLICLTIIVVLILSYLPVHAYTNPTSSHAGEHNQYDKIDTYIQEKLEMWNVPGASLAIVENGKIVHTHGFGQTGNNNEIPSPQTPYMIGSVTKSFTSLAIMQLVEEGRVDLDTPIQKYLPWFTLADPQAASLITVRHLLNQTSGLPQIRGMSLLADFDTTPNAIEKQARALSDLSPARPAGTEWEYSNLNFNLLGLIIESVSGETYAGYVENHIFVPLDMNHSFSNKADAVKDQLAVGHQMRFGFPIAVPDLPVPAGSLPSGQLISSAEDISHYMIAQLNGGMYNGKKILSTDGISEMHKLSASVYLMDNDLGDYGMGWFVKQSGKGPLVYHYGEVPDYFAYVALLPQQNRGLVLLINANEQLYTYAFLDMGEACAKILAGDSPHSDSWGILPWVLRALLLLPVIQVLGIWLIIRRMSLWRQETSCIPGSLQLWSIYLIPPTIIHLILVGSSLAVIFSGLFNFMMLFMGDMIFMILVSGMISSIWLVYRTILFTRILRKK